KIRYYVITALCQFNPEIFQVLFWMPAFTPCDYSGVYGTYGSARNNIKFLTLSCQRLEDAASKCTKRASSLQHQHIFDNSRSEEHTSELQSRENLVCRLLLDKKKR